MRITDKLRFENQEDDEFTEIEHKQRRVYSDKPDRSIYELYRQYQKGNLDLQPEFQRLQVWDNKKASRLIESVLLEVPIPVIYLNEDSESKYSVIDGQQRLKSFIRFLENDLRLNGLNILTELNGKKFQDLPKNVQDKFESSTIRIIEIRKESHPDVKFEIFERLNTGSVQLNAQELRNCIYRGKYNELLKELSYDKDFQFLLGLREPHSRMQDRELILRFFAFFHNNYLNYKPPMKRFLNRDMERFRNLDEEEEKELRKVFKKSVKLAKTVFADKAFKRFLIGSEKDKNGRWETKKVNKALYDIIMFGFTIYEENQIIPNADSIREELIWLMTNDFEFIDSITFTTDKKEKIHLRFNKWLDSLEKIVGSPIKEPRTFSLHYKKQLWETNPYCAICGQAIHVLDDAEVDHVEQYWRGGKTIPSNSRLTHRYCNRTRNKFSNDKMVFTHAATVYNKKTKIKRKSGATPRSEYYLHILEILVSNGGQARQREVFKILEERMKNRFNDLDLELLKDGYTYRWQKNVAFARLEMVERGLLLSDSPRGIWKISEQGRVYLKMKKIKN